MGWALTLGTKTIQILGSYIRDRREYIVVIMSSFYLFFLGHLDLSDIIETMIPFKDRIEWYWKSFFL